MNPLQDRDEGSRAVLTPHLIVDMDGSGRFRLSVLDAGRQDVPASGVPLASGCCSAHRW